MANVYPKKKIVKYISPIDENLVALRIIFCMRADKSKAVSIGECLQGSDDIATFNRVWNEIVSEGNSFRSLSPADYKTEEEYKAELTKKKKYLDVDLFIAGIKSESSVDSFKDLKEKLDVISI